MKWVAAAGRDVDKLQEIFIQDKTDISCQVSCPFSQKKRSQTIYSANYVANLLMATFTLRASLLNYDFLLRFDLSDLMAHIHVGK